jgi:hypothetical protein
VPVRPIFKTIHRHRTVGMGYREMLVDAVPGKKTEYPTMGGNMAARKRGMNPNGADNEPEDICNPPKTEFRVLGEEMIEKEVKTSGKTGRVYLPGDWVGRLVKIIRMN